MLFECQISNSVSQLPLILDGLEQAGADNGWDMAVQMQIALVVEELVVNAATYGGQASGEGWVSVRIDQVAEGLQIVIEDNGAPFNPFTAATPDIELDLDSRAIGGLGVHFVREMTQQQSYERIGQTNRVTLLKVLPGG